MFHPDKYISALIRLLRAAFGARLIYVGLQGSYLRGEATESSDIDIMVVIDGMSTADLTAYRQAIASLPDSDKSCGFICGREDLLHWNPLEICHLLHTTQDHFGALAELVPPYTLRDVRAYVQLSAGNLYHELSHRFIHAPASDNIAAFPAACRQVFFILQNLHYLDSGVFHGTKAALLPALSGRDRAVLEMALACSRGESFDFDSAFPMLLSWCREVLVRASSPSVETL